MLRIADCGLRSSSLRRFVASSLVSAFLVVSPAAAQEPPPIPASVDVAPLRELAVQHDGRWPPLDTVARDVVQQVTGSMTWQGQDPVRILLAWAFNPQPWKDARLITIANAELRGLLELDPARKTFSFSELVGHPRLRQLMSDLGRKDRKEMDALDRKVEDISGQLNLLDDALSGQILCPVPDPKDFGGAWQPAAPAAGHSHGTASPVAAEWAAVGQAFNADDAAAFASATKTLLEKLSALPAAHRPDPSDLKLEVRANRLQPFRIAFYVTAFATILAALRMFAGRSTARTLLSVLTFVAIVVGFALVSYGIGVRWHLAGRIPAANMYESMLFLAWGVGAFDIIAILLLRQPIVSFKSALLATGALALVNFVGLDWPIRPVAPVLLDTVWMAIHVPTIMVSYSILFDAFVIAHIQLVVLAAVPRNRGLIRAVDQLHYWFMHIGSILLFAGIVTGSMWAAFSWGRYWGWDPKEVWSLIAYLAYLTIMHVRLDREEIPGWMKYVLGVLVVAMFAVLVKLFAPVSPLFLAGMAVAALVIVVFVTGRGGELSTAVKSILAAWMVGMTYVGVNYVLGIGLHSYGFGTGAVVTWAYRIGAIDLSIMGLCVLVHLARGGGQQRRPVSGSTGAPATGRAPRR